MPVGFSSRGAKSLPKCSSQPSPALLPAFDTGRILSPGTPLSVQSALTKSQTLELWTSWKA